MYLNIHVMPTFLQRLNCPTAWLKGHTTNNMCNIRQRMILVYAECRVSCMSRLCVMYFKVGTIYFTMATELFVHVVFHV